MMLDVLTPEWLEEQVRLTEENNLMVLELAKANEALDQIIRNQNVQFAANLRELQNQELFEELRRKIKGGV